jgi:general secretion pathway protein H
MRVSKKRPPSLTRFKALNCYGYTLIELLLVMILITMAGSMVYVSVGKSMADNQQKALIREMASLCKSARRMAMEDGAPTPLRISSAERRCWIGDTTKSVGFPKEMGVEGEGFCRSDEDVYTINFYPDGSSDGGELLLTVLNKPFYTFRIDRLTGTITLTNAKDKGV